MRYFREPVSGFTHLFSAGLAAVGLVWLMMQTWHDPAKMAAMVVYGSSLILLYSASSALHLIHASERGLFWLRRFDHAAIYVLIAGTYTPIVYTILDGYWRWGVLGLVWTVAIAGCVFKLLYLHGYHHLSTVIYVLLGWGGVLLVPEALKFLAPSAALLILAGGIVYTCGAVIYAWGKPNFHPQFGSHELWHLFVMAGSGLHFVAVLRYIA